VDCTYGFLTWVNHGGIYVKLQDRHKLHFTNEDYGDEADLNKQICEELAELSCSEKTIAPLYIDSIMDSLLD
jgi:hypothetical protein